MWWLDESCSEVDEAARQDRGHAAVGRTGHSRRAVTDRPWSCPTNTRDLIGQNLRATVHHRVRGDFKMPGWPVKMSASKSADHRLTSARRGHRGRLRQSVGVEQGRISTPCAKKPSQADTPPVSSACERGGDGRDPGDGDMMRAQWGGGATDTAPIYLRWEPARKVIRDCGGTGRRPPKRLDDNQTTDELGNSSSV